MATPNANGVTDAAQTFTVILTAKQHEALMYAALDQATRSMSNADDIFAGMRDAADQAKHVDDVVVAMKLVRDDFDAIEALGWPNAPEDR